MPPDLNVLAQNALLAMLPSADLDLLTPHLEMVELPLRMRLDQSNRPIERAYFINRGIASVVTDGPGKQAIEVCVIGREGMTGLPILMGADRWPNETYMQVAGRGLSIAVAALEQALDRSRTMHRVFLQYAHVFIV